jgi:diguanylate cyclase (GGDEF)-like protein
MSNRPVAVIILVAVASALVTLATDGTHLLYLWWMIVPGAALSAIVDGVRRHQPSHRTPWGVLAASMALLWVGWTISAVLASGRVTGGAGETAAAVRDVLYLLAYPSLGVASLLMVRRRTGGRDRENVVDAAIVMAALAILLAAWLFGGGETAEGVSGLERVWVSVAPLMLAAVLGVSVRLLFADGSRLPAAWLLFAGSGLALLGNMWTLRLLRAGAPTQVIGIDVLWVLGFVAVASAALHPSMRALTEPVRPERLVDGMPVDRLVLIGVALTATPFAQLRLTGGTMENRAVAAGGLLVAGLVLWRLVGLLHERDEARQAVTDAAARDAMMATLGRWALDRRSTPQLLADTEELLGDRLHGVRTRILTEDATEDAVDQASSVSWRYDVDDGTTIIARLRAVAPAARPAVAGEAEFLEAVASLLSTAVRRRALESQLRHDAMHDPLTGLPNRTLAINRIEQVLAHRDAAVTAIFIDINGFKAVNDTLGHQAGDRVLIDLAERLTRAVRPGDTVARFAGDEFLVLVPNIDRAGIEQLVDRLGEATTRTVTGDGHELPITASLGIASSTGDLDADALLRSADTAMYQAKNAGTNAPVWFGTPADPMLDGVSPA